MRRVVCVLAVAISVGCSRDKFAPLGDAAPAFGSTRELSTLQAFAVSTWRESYDPATEGAGPHFLKAAVSLDAPVMTLSADGRVALQSVKHTDSTAHGTWTINGDQIAFSFTDVDGLTFDQVDAQLQNRQKENRQVRRILTPLSRTTPYVSEGIALTRHLLASECHAFPNLVVGPGGRRLDEVLDTGPNANSYVEKAIWLRVK